MSEVIVGIIGFVVLFAMLAVGLPVGFSMAVVGFAGFAYLVSEGAAFCILGTTPFDVVCSYSLSVLPLFILMAHIVNVSAISKDLYALAAKWLGHQPGGLAMATTGACAAFAAVSASSIATSATIGLASIPEMRKHNYDPALATGSVAAGGTMGVLIPPSGVLIVYAIITETSIGKLFAAGIVPGILEALFYIVTIYIVCRWKPNYGPRGPRFSFREKVAAFGPCAEMIALVVLVLGGLIIGWFTPTEAGAVGAFGAIIFSLVRRRLDWKKFRQAILDTMATTGMIYCIMIGAFILNYFVAVSNIPIAISEIVGGMSLPPLGIMGVLMVVYLFLGCFLDPMAMMLLTMPVFFPLAQSLGFDAIWFGIVLVRMMEIAGITPPVGMNVYVIAGVAPDIPMSTIFKGVVPFLIADMFHVALLLFIPAVVLFLPGIMQ
jgi:C4-dicarboxylate transporter DctM subunit